MLLRLSPEERRCRRSRLGGVALGRLPHFFLLVYLSENKRKFHSLEIILVCWGKLVWVAKQSCMFRFCFEPSQPGSYRAYFWGGSELRLRSVCLCSWFWEQCCTRTDRSASSCACTCSAVYLRARFLSASRLTVECGAFCPVDMCIME